MCWAACWKLAHSWAEETKCAGLSWSRSKGRHPTGGGDSVLVLSVWEGRLPLGPQKTLPSSLLGSWGLTQRLAPGRATCCCGMQWELSVSQVTQPGQVSRGVAQMEAASSDSSRGEQKCTVLVRLKTWAVDRLSPRNMGTSAIAVKMCHVPLVRGYWL